MKIRFLLPVLLMLLVAGVAGVFGIFAFYPHVLPRLVGIGNQQDGKTQLLPDMSKFPKMPSAKELRRQRDERLAAALKNEELILAIPKEGRDDTGAYRYSVQPTKGIENGYIEDLSYSSDGRTIACSLGVGGLADNPKWIELWDIVERKKICELQWSRNKRLSTPVFSPNGRMLISVEDRDGQPNQIVIWHAATGKLARTIEDRGLDILSKLVFTPDGTMVAATARDNDWRMTRITWWRLDDGQKIGSFRPPNGCNKLAISPDGRLFATSSDSDVAVWSLPDCKLLATYNSSRPGDLTFSSTGEYLAMPGVNVVQLVDLASGKITQTPAQGIVRRMSFLADQKMVIHNQRAGSASPIRVLEIPSLEVVIDQNNSGTWWEFALSPNERVLLSWSFGTRISVIAVKNFLAAKEAYRANQLVAENRRKKSPLYISNKGRYLTVDFPTRTKNFSSGATNAFLAEVANMHFVKDLRIRGNLTDQGMEVLPKLKHLQEFTLENMPNVTNTGLRHLATLRSVEKLKLTALDNVGDDGLAHIKTLKNLHLLTIDSMPQLSERGFAHLAHLPALRELEIFKCSLSEGSYRQIGQLTQLQSFRPGGDIDDRGLAQLAGLKNIELLSLQRSRVTDAGLIVVRKMPRLKRLIMDATNISDDAFANLAGLQHLESIAVWNMRRFHGRGLKELRNCKKLKNISLFFTFINDDGFRHISHLTQLTNLSIPKNVTDAGLKHLAKLTNLEKLYLNNNITSQGLVHLRTMKELRLVGLSDTKVTDPGLTYLQNLKNLTKLEIARTSINGSGLSHLENLPNLTELDLGQTKIDDKCLAHVAGMKSLSRLNLYETNISDVGLKHLHQMKQLRSVSLSDTQVTNDGLTALRRSLPNTDISPQYIFDRKR